MCNGWNHPFDCTCGWGGVGHLGKRSPGVPLVKLSSRADDVTPKDYGARESYTNPNAKCPVCSAKVYFYRSPDNGRVFFDELGPPWPKHVCTISSSPKLLKVPAGQKPKDLHRSQFGWERDGWAPLVVHEIRAIPSVPEWCGIRASYKGRGWNLFAKSTEVPRHTLFHARGIDNDSFEVSYFLIGENQQILIREFTAVVNVPVTGSTRSPNQPSSLGKPVGSMADALRKAGVLNKN